MSKLRIVTWNINSRVLALAVAETTGDAAQTRYSGITGNEMPGRIAARQCTDGSVGFGHLEFQRDEIL